jgi:small subunit ribosomal protein S5
MSRRRYEEEPKVWKPKTRLGLLVSTGKVTTLNEVFENGWKIKEPEIVKTLLPEIKSEVVNAGIVQKQTDAGELTRFVAIVAVGDGAGWFGVGRGKASQMRLAIEKATSNALLNIIPVKIGCGSWECKCGRTHSIPFRTSGKGGSVKVELIPGPRGLGLVAGETIRNLLALAGIEDVWTRTYGSTSTASSVAYAVYDALKKVHGLSVVVE